jgi:hypothetical protein
MPFATMDKVRLSGCQVAAIAEYLHIEVLSESDALKFIHLDGEYYTSGGSGDAHSLNPGGSGYHPTASCQNLSATSRHSHQDAVNALIGKMLADGPLA